jgi:hypothetical protein
MQYRLQQDFMSLGQVSVMVFPEETKGAFFADRQSLSILFSNSDRFLIISPEAFLAMCGI